MATKLSKIETLQEAKKIVRKAFRPSDEDSEDSNMNEVVI